VAHLFNNPSPLFFAMFKGGIVMNSTCKPRWSVLVPRQFNAAQREMDQVFNHFFGDSEPSGKAWFAPTSLWEEEGHWAVEVDLPGIRQEDLDITVENNQLRLAAERKAPEAERKYAHHEHAYGRIERVITLPETVDVEKIEAELKDGVLRLQLAKRPESQPKKVQVKVS
jgi:HSP20 family protein